MVARSRTLRWWQPRNHARRLQARLAGSYAELLFTVNRGVVRIRPTAYPTAALIPATSQWMGCPQTWATRHYKHVVIGGQ